jgi:hypothetical protein
LWSPEVGPPYFAPRYHFSTVARRWAAARFRSTVDFSLE